jgi:hypothetical protein
MTTGRINQVTILNAGAARAGAKPWDPSPDPRPAAPGEGRQKLVSTSRSVRRALDPRRRTAPLQAPPVGITGHPIAPTEFPKGWSAAGCNSFGPGITRATPSLWHTPLERRIPADRSRRTPERADGYRPRLTPRNLNKNLSQGPIIHRPHRSRKDGAFRCSVGIPR